MESPRLTALLILSDAVLMEEISVFFETYIPSIEIKGKCYSLSDGLLAYSGLQPDVVVIDLDFESVKEIQKLEETSFGLSKTIGLISSTSNIPESCKEWLNGLLFKPLE